MKAAMRRNVEASILIRCWAGVRVVVGEEKKAAAAAAESAAQVLSESEPLATRRGFIRTAHRDRKPGQDVRGDHMLHQQLPHGLSPYASRTDQG